MSLFGNYIFTNKKHPTGGIMSVILGVIAIVSIILAIYLSYLDGGNARMQYGLAAVLAFLMALAGEILGLISNGKKDRFAFFPLLGITLNTIVLFGGVYILYAGI